LGLDQIEFDIVVVEPGVRENVADFGLQARRMSVAVTIGFAAKVGIVRDFRAPSRGSGVNRLVDSGNFD